MQRLLVGSSLLFEKASPTRKASPTPSGGSRPPAPAAVEKRFLGVERVSLDENTLKIQLAEQLSEHCPLMVFAGGVAGLAVAVRLLRSSTPPQGSRIQRDLGNKRGTPAGRGLIRAPQGLTVTHQLIEIRCTTKDLGDRPVANRSAQRRHVHLVEEVAERGIRWWSRQFDTKSNGKNAVVADGIGEAFFEGVALQIPQALATAQDSQHGYQQQKPGWKANPAPHPRIWDRPQLADQVEIGGGRSAFGHKEEAIPPTSTHADSPDKAPCDGL